MSVAGGEASGGVGVTVVVWWRGEGGRHGKEGEEGGENKVREVKSSTTNI